MWLRYEPLSACIDCTALANEHGKETFDAVSTVLAYSTQIAEFELWIRYKPQLRYLNFYRIYINFSNQSYIINFSNQSCIKPNASVVGDSVYAVFSLMCSVFIVPTGNLWLP
jgi:hypothetical protein